MSWGKEETDAALRAARAVATRLRARVAGGEDGEGEGGHEKQRLLSEVGGWVGGCGHNFREERGGGGGSCCWYLRVWCVVVVHGPVRAGRSARWR